jgi:hypothetical protein
MLLDLCLVEWINSKSCWEAINQEGWLVEIDKKG